MYPGENMGLFAAIKSRFYGAQPEEADEYEPLLRQNLQDSHPKLRDPPFYTFSPIQSWLTPIMGRTEKSDFFDAEDLPTFSKDANHLRDFIAPLTRNDLLGFIRQREIGGQLLIGGALEVSPS